MPDWLNPVQIPLWLKIAYTLFICVLAPVYVVQYGPGNFLWFSDIALFVTADAFPAEETIQLDDLRHASRTAVNVTTLRFACI
jgi:hypothetical protein